MKRNPARIIEAVVWPFLEIILFGFLAVSGSNKPSETTTAIASILTGIVYWNWTARIIQESVAQFLDDINSKNIQSLLISPLTHIELILSITLVSLTKLVVTFLIIGLALYLVYPNFYNGVGQHVVLWAIQLELTGISLSIVGIGIILLFGARLSFIGWGISTVLQIFSLVFYERTTLPSALQVISYLSPPSYIFESIRSVHNYSYNNNIVLFLNLLYLIFSFVFFRFAFLHAKKIGTFTKL